MPKGGAFIGWKKIDRRGRFRPIWVLPTAGNAWLLISPLRSRLNISTNRGGGGQIQLSELRLYRFVPALAISGSDSNVILQWINNGPGFYLEYRTNLSTGGWISNSTLPSTNFNGSIHWVTHAIDANEKFFRLRSP
jgi:hypothetical protein